MLDMFRIGLPAGIQNSLFSISNVLIQSSINSFGSDAFTSGNGAAQNIDTFLSVGLESFAQASLNFTAQNAGARNFERVRKAFTTCLKYVFVLGAVAGSAVWFFGELLLSFYITDSPEAIAYGLIRFTYIALPYCLGGMMNVSTGALRGLGVSFIPMLISILGVCGIRIAWIYTVFQIPAYHTPSFLYLVFPISWAATFAMQTVAYLIVLKRKSKTNRLQPHTA
jgi:Na+-driven multidrug efflux pump